MSTVLRNVGWLLSGRGVNALFSLVYLALATRTLGLDGYGRFALVVVLAQSVSGLASFNSWQTVVRWGTGPEGAGRVAGFALALDLASIAGGLVIAAALCWSAPLWLPLPAPLRPTAFLLCAAALLAIRSTPTGLLRLHDRYDLATLAEATLSATRALGAVAAAFLMPDVRGFVAAWAVAEIVCAAAYWLLASRYVRIDRSHVALMALPRAEPGLWRFVVTTNLSRSLAVTSKQILVLGIGAIGGAALAGGFRVASQLGQALVQLGEAISRATFPEYVRLGQSAAVVAGRISAMAAAIGMLATLLAALAGDRALIIIAGPEFLFTYSALVLIALAGALDLAAASWDALIVARGRAGLGLVLRAGPLLAALSAMPFAIGHRGLEGVGMCILAASAVSLAGLSYVGLARPFVRSTAGPNL